MTVSAERQTKAIPPEIARFKESLLGELVLPDDPRYCEARKVWNGMVDRKPAMIAYCAGPEDVIKAVDFARSKDLLVAVRAGGHNIAGSSVCDGGLVVDVSRMKGLQIDRERRIVRSEAGLTLGEFDTGTQSHGLATTMGVNSDTGIAGLTLGGGIGRLGRKYGLACDNLVAAEMVTADCKLLRVSASENPDLFWGIRGGGGNFGIVTAFEYRIHPVGPMVLGGSIDFPYEGARDALRFYGEFSSSAPDELSADAALVMANTREPLLSIIVCHSGSLDEGERAVKPLRMHGTPRADNIGAVPYVQLQKALDGVFLRGRRYYWKSHFLGEITDAAIDVLLRAYSTAPSSLSVAVLQQVGGAISRIPVSATAYGNRDAAYDFFPIAIWEDPDRDEANMRWVRDLWTAMRPFATGGVYVNNLGDEGEDRIRAAYGANYQRLVALKNRYDPKNLFRANQNIRPTLGS